jgi:hypothetical protein
MRIARFAAAAVVVALALSACGSTTKPVAGTPQAAAQARKGLNDPRTKHIACLRADHVTDIREYMTGGLPAFQVGTAPSGPTVVFEPTDGMAQGVQIAGKDLGAEIIGAAVVYPNDAPAKLDREVESCVALGVSG